MLSEPKWTFDLYLRSAREQRIAAGAYGWRLKFLPWLRNNPVVQLLETHDRVVAAMQPIDRVDPANLGAEAKSKIAQRSGCTVQQVNAVIKQVITAPRVACRARRQSPPSFLIAFAFPSSRLTRLRFCQGYGQPQHARVDAAVEGGKTPLYCTLCAARCVAAVAAHALSLEP